jgi:nitrite reductase/ring-hydroxylating ferredoxin subunit/uncharacterized membrane protein
MRSRAHIKGHPIHPILITFPIAFFVGTLIFDVLSVLANKPAYWKTGQYLETAGIISGVLAAIPGFIDYMYTVPPGSSAKQRASKHALTNISMLVVFTLALINRQLPHFSVTLQIGFEFGGVILLMIAGWMGATLVHSNQIGVNVRYANSGKWNEMNGVDDKGRVEVATTDELDVNQLKLVHVNDKRIVIAKTEEGYVAFDDFCTHKGGSLAGGSMICGTVQCPWHGSHFDVNTGAVKAGPATKPIKVYTIEYAGDKVYVQLHKPQHKQLVD